MSFGKIAVCLTLAGILGGAGCRHVASESRAPATVKEQLDSQGAAAATKEGEAKPAEGEAKPAEGEAKPAEGEAKPAEGEAKPEPGSEDKE